MRLMASFFRAYPLHTALMLAALLLSGLAEGIGLSALLLLLNIGLGVDAGTDLVATGTDAQNNLVHAASRVYYLQAGKIELVDAAGLAKLSK